MEVHADLRIGKSLLNPPHRTDYLRAEAPPVGIAQHQPFGSLLVRRPQHGQREAGIGGVAVEEVLGVEEHPPTVAGQVGDRLGHHGDSLVEVGSQCLPDVVVPRFADDAHHLGLGLQQVEHLGIPFDDPAGSSGRGEGRQRSCPEVQFRAGSLEELAVLGVGARPAAFYVGDPELVEKGCDAELVGDGQGYALLLGAVAQGGVVYLELWMCHRRLSRPSHLYRCQVVRAKKRPSAGAQGLGHGIIRVPMPLVDNDPVEVCHVSREFRSPNSPCQPLARV